MLIFFLVGLKGFCVSDVLIEIFKGYVEIFNILSKYKCFEVLYDRF